MRKLRPSIVIGLALAASAALAAPYAQDAIVNWFKRGVYIGSGATASTANLLSKTVASAAITYDCAEVDAGTCLGSAAQTVTGAAVGDTCTVGPNATAGALPGTWSCYVSAADAVKINFCAHGAANVDPASGAFRVRVFSNQ